MGYCYSMWGGVKTHNSSISELQKLLGINKKPKPTLSQHSYIYGLSIETQNCPISAIQRLLISMET